MTDNSPHISFTLPEHGWMTVSVAWEENRCDWEVSDAVCDSLSQLVDALIGMMTGSGEEEVFWFLEPEELCWRFRAQNSDLELEMKQGEGEGPGQVLRAEKDLFVGAFIRALTALGARTCWTSPEAMENTWSWPFPKKRYEVLVGLTPRVNAGK